MHYTAEKAVWCFFVGKIVICKLFMNPIDKVGKQEYSFSSRTDRVLKQSKLVRQEVHKAMEQKRKMRYFRFCGLCAQNS